MKYIPTPGPLPGEQYIPYGAESGDIFLDGLCANCERDKSLNGTKQIDDCEDDDLCPIVGASFEGKAVEWRDVDGVLRCIKFVPKGAIIPCENTPDMFA